MKTFLEFVATQLVDRPADVVVRVAEHGGVEQYVLELPRSEVGKIIGKQGHTIHAIRSLLMAALSRHGRRGTFEIVERAEESTGQSDG